MRKTEQKKPINSNPAKKEIINLYLSKRLVLINEAMLYARIATHHGNNRRTHPAVRRNIGQMETGTWE
jgi:hypothetical protein